jgi:hypothetical protein
VVPDWLMTVAVLGGFAALVWFAFGREPHWSSRDGTRFICRAQLVEIHGRSDGRWREVRGSLSHDGTVAIQPRGLGGREMAGNWRPESATPEESGRKVSILLRGERILVLRMPRDSRTARLLVDLLQK